MDESNKHKWKATEQFLFKHLVEVLILSGVLLLLLTAVAPFYQKSLIRSKVSSSYENLNELVEALMLYSHEQPVNQVFPPTQSTLSPGISLCPIIDPYPENLSFLTTPVSYLANVPCDPFVSEVLDSSEFLTPFVVHWIRSGNDHSLRALGYSNIGWGAFSIGPALDLPPQYTITILRRVPYENGSLSRNLYNPSNGMNSVGLIYYDSLGNRSALSEM